MHGRIARLRRATLGVRLAVLAGVMIGLYLALLPTAYALWGLAGIYGESVAAGVCLCAAALALALSERWRSPSRAMVGMLLSMTIRTGLPLLAALGLHLRGGLDKAGTVYYLLMFYLVGLGVETALGLPPHEPAGNRRPDAR